MKIEPNYFGKDGFFWWVGVVEDRRDPLKLGRVRVRVLGCHSEIKEMIPSGHLHWAYVYQPTTSQAMNGLGHSPTGPGEGTWVFGFFKDADNAQDPVVLGTVPGIPQEAPTPTLGFNDPSAPFHELEKAPRKIYSRHYPNDGTGAQIKDESTAKLYPREVHPWGCTVGEPDTNRLARAEKVDDTIIGVKRRQRDVQVPIALSHPKPERQWNEPESKYNARYPYNHVIETESGHVIEFDDTPKAERLHVYHRTGTAIEIDMEGNLVMKVVGKKYEITMEQAYSHFQNTMNVTVDGETNIYCRSNANVQVDGNLKVHVQGDYEERIHGNYTTHVDGNREIKVGGKLTTDVKKERNAKVGGADTVDVKGKHSLTVAGPVSRHSLLSITDVAGLNIKQTAGLNFEMVAALRLKGTALMVLMNPGFPVPLIPSVPDSPSSPVVPPFPAKLDRWKETVNETGSKPVKEEKSDPAPKRNDGQKED